MGTGTLQRYVSIYLRIMKTALRLIAAATVLLGVNATTPTCFQQHLKPGDVLCTSQPLVDKTVSKQRCTLAGHTWEQVTTTSRGNMLVIQENMTWLFELREDGSWLSTSNGSALIMDKLGHQYQTLCGDIVPPFLDHEIVADMTDMIGVE
eukprot:GFYU01000469.1.p2 GENE.GFYU01000469.1~~GFYU01000469.1.p2  ORF type:complete len:150 (-),score=36.67 GFYU01000469.1:103-552(-)